MLRHRRNAKAEELGHVSHRAFAVDQLTDNEQPMAIGQRFQQIARAIGGGFHRIDANVHILRIYDYSNVASRINTPASQTQMAQPNTKNVSKRRRPTPEAPFFRGMEKLRQRPLNRGFRRCRKASTPSLWSSVRLASANWSTSIWPARSSSA